MKTLFVFCVVVLVGGVISNEELIMDTRDHLTANIQRLMNCMQQGYTTPTGDDNAAFYIARNTSLLSCRPHPHTNCVWVERNALYATPFIFLNHRVIALTFPRRQLDPIRWQMTTNMLRMGIITRVYQHLYPTDGKATYISLLDSCW